MGLSPKVIRLAARQGGYVKREQLLNAGLSESAVDRRLGSGDLTIVIPSLYQVFPSTDHVDLIRGALLGLPNAVASHQSAAHLLDFPLLPALEPTVTVPSPTTHRFPGVTVRRNDDLDPSHLTGAKGLRVTNIQRSVFDLAGVLKFRDFDRIAEALLLDGRLKMRHFDLIVCQLARRGKPGSRSARDFVAMRSGEDPKATKLERKGRAILAAGGLPQPVPQYPIPWDRHRRFDDAYPDATLAIEWDSRAWHLQQQAMSSDRQRDRVAAAHGWIVVRFTWTDLMEKRDEVVATVATLLQDRSTS